MNYCSQKILARKISSSFNQVSHEYGPMRLDLIQFSLTFVTELLTLRDKEVIVECCRAIEYLTDRSHQVVQMIVEHGIVPKIIGLLGTEEDTILEPALKIIRNVASGSNNQISSIIEAGGLHRLARLMRHHRQEIVRQAVNITAVMTVSNKDTVQHIMRSGVLPLLINILQTGDAELHLKASHTVENLTRIASLDELSQMIQEGVLVPFCNLLDSKNFKTIVSVLGGLENILDTTKLHGADEIEKIACKITEIGVLDKLRDLQCHEDGEIRDKVNKIIKRHFPDLSLHDSPSCQSMTPENLSFTSENQAPSSDNLTFSPEVVSLVPDTIFIPTEEQNHAMRSTFIDFIPILLGLVHLDTPLVFARQIVEMFSNLCRDNNPSIPHAIVKSALPTIKTLLRNEDKEILASICQAVEYLTDDNDNIRTLMEFDIMPHLTPLLVNNDIDVLLPTLRIIGNIMELSEVQIDSLYVSSIMERLVTLFKHPRKAVVKQAAWTMSKAAIGNKIQIQRIVNFGLFPSILNILSHSENLSQKEAVRVIADLIECGCREHMTPVVKPVFFGFFFKALDTKNMKCIMVILDGLEHLVRAARDMDEKVSLTIKKVGLFDRLKELQHHDNVEIRQKITRILFYSDLF